MFEKYIRHIRRLHTRFRYTNAVGEESWLLAVDFVEYYINIIRPMTEANFCAICLHLVRSLLLIRTRAASREGV